MGKPAETDRRPLKSLSHSFTLDLVILVDAHPRHEWLVAAVTKRLREEVEKLRVEINEEKSRIVDLRKGESFGFLGFEFRLVRSLKGTWRPQYTPKRKKRTALLAKLREICLTLPETSERLSHGAPTFFVRQKRAFVTVMTDHHGDGRFALWCAAPEG